MHYLIAVFAALALLAGVCQTAFALLLNIPGGEFEQGLMLIAAGIVLYAFARHLQWHKEREREEK